MQLSLGIPQSCSLRDIRHIKLAGQLWVSCATHKHPFHGQLLSAVHHTLKFDTLHLPFASLCFARQAVQQKCPEQSLHTLPAAQVTYALILWPLLPCGLVQAAPRMQRMRPGIMDIQYGHKSWVSV
jgi:hypothetical protein